MWRIEYSEEVRNYFFDNYPYTFDLHVKIESLFFSKKGIPEEGRVILEPPNFVIWSILDHAIVYQLFEDRIYVQVVKSL